MRAKDPDSELAAVAAQLRSDPRVSSYRFITHADMYSESTKLFTGHPAIPKIQVPKPRSSSFQIILRKSNDATAVARSYADVPGVLSVAVERSSN